MFFEYIYNWFINGVFRIHPAVKVVILLSLLLVALWFLKMGIQGSNAKTGYRLKDFKIGYFIAALVSILLMVVMLIF